MSSPSTARRFTHEGKSGTTRQWAEWLGITQRSFQERLRKWGTKDFRTWRTKDEGVRDQRVRASAKRSVKLVQHCGEWRTVSQWAQWIGISAQTLRHRLKRWGADDPRTWEKGEAGSPTNKLGSVCLAGPIAQSVQGTGMGVQRTSEERLAVIDLYREEWPELVDNTFRLEQVVSSLVRVLGSLSSTEVGHLLGTTRQRADQIAIIALKKAKLRGGAELRQTWEDGNQDREDAWDTYTQYAVGTW